jgi:hypothetical protein
MYLSASAKNSQRGRGSDYYLFQTTTSPLSLLSWYLNRWPRSIKDGYNPVPSLPSSRGARAREWFGRFGATWSS